jgi:hypothetical protein
VKHFRDYAPDAALPNYSGQSFTYRNDGMRVAIDGLFFEMDVSVACNGMSDGLFEPDDVTARDVFGNEQSFPYVGARERGSVGLRAGVLNAIDREWPTIEAWLVEKAEEER